jgi:type II secretory pathway predicted ATPase ExeA
VEIKKQQYRLFFGFEKEPFQADISVDQILKTPQLSSAENRFEYALELGAVYLITGEIGAGKSTAIRYLLAGLHPSEYKVIYVTATAGSILELYRLILGQLGLKRVGMSRAAMIEQIKREVLDLISGKKINAAVVVDEASLLRLEVFTELHTLCQFEMDSKPYLPLVLSGQSNLIDKLMYPGSMPLASRVVAKSHFVGAERDQMHAYLMHHLNIAGVKTMLFDDNAITAIHQGSGGIYRKANHLARGALIAAAMENKKSVTADHVRVAASEIF